MYLFIRILVIVLCISGILYFIWMNGKYKNDTSTSKEDIVNYFRAQKATSLENGIRIKDLPIDIAKNPYLLLMVKGKTLVFKQGKYYLNLDK